MPVQNPYAEDVKGVQRMAATPIEINPWNVPVQTSIPQVHLLSNGSYSVLLSNMGGGYSTWRDVDLTRWQSDGVRDPWGTWIYIQDMDPARRALWSVGFQPILSSPANIQVTYFAHMAVFRRTENDIISTFDVTVSPDDPVEIRRVHLHNNTDQPRRLRLTSYGEVILTQQAGDTRHPAFNKLFIESEYVPEFGLQIFKRRARSNQEAPVFMGHMLVNDDNPQHPSQHGEVRHEADRYRFHRPRAQPARPGGARVAGIPDRHDRRDARPDFCPGPGGGAGAARQRRPGLPDPGRREPQSHLEPGRALSQLEPGRPGLPAGQFRRRRPGWEGRVFIPRP